MNGEELFDHERWMEDQEHGSGPWYPVRDDEDEHGILDMEIELAFQKEKMAKIKNELDELYEGVTRSGATVVTKSKELTLQNIRNIVEWRY